jgi:hypothetical protein
LEVLRSFSESREQTVACAFQLQEAFATLNETLVEIYTKYKLLIECLYEKQIRLFRMKKFIRCL